MSAVSDGQSAHRRALQELEADQGWMDGRKLKTCAKCYQDFTLDCFHSSRRAHRHIHEKIKLRPPITQTTPCIRQVP